MSNGFELPDFSRFVAMQQRTEALKLGYADTIYERIMLPDWRF